MIHPFTNEQEALQQDLRTFGDEHIRESAMDYISDSTWPWPIYEQAAQRGLIGREFPEKFGGKNGSVVEECLVAEELCRADSSIGIAVHSGTIGCFPVNSYGNRSQKETILPQVTSGESITAIGLTEPDTGSSLSQISTGAERVGDSFEISGAKKWIANGISADWTVTLCRTGTDEAGPTGGLSLIIIPTDADGYRAREISKMGLDASEHAYIEFDNVVVPDSNVVGEADQGFSYITNWLTQGRLTTAAAHLGMAEGAFELALNYATNREQGGGPVSDYQGIRWKFADMKKSLSTSKAHLYSIAEALDRYYDHGQYNKVDLIEQSSVAKLNITEMAVDVTREAVQIFGGNGYQKKHRVEHFYRDAKAGTIYEGTSEIQRNTIGKTIFGEI